MKINIPKVVSVDAKILSINMKCRDTFECSLVDADGDEIVSYEGYVPEFMPGEHYGDYLMLDINIETGQIQDWVPLTAGVVEKFIKDVEKSVEDDE